MKCPCCGGEVDTDLPIVSLDTNTVAYRGQWIRSQPRIIELLHILRESYPRPVHRDAIRTGLWGYGEPPKSVENCISVFVTQARAAVQLLGLGIENIHTGRYLLTIDRMARTGRWAIDRDGLTPQIRSIASRKRPLIWADE